VNPTDVDRAGEDRGPGAGRGWAARRSRPHRWPCRHCGMVTDYHLLRDAQVRAVESLERRDEIDRLITFKEWLRAYEWDTDPRRRDLDDHVSADQVDGQVAAGNECWGQQDAADLAVPQQRSTPPDRCRDAVGAARRAVDAIPDNDPASDHGWSTTRVTAADEHTADDAVGIGAEAAGWRWAS
jgi:hypothetical protein